MSVEIERKFLVKGPFKQFAVKSFRISQGYLSSVPQRTVRIRIRDNRAFITIKGQSNLTGISRYEWEKEIPVDEARELLKICEPVIIEKTRFIVPAGNDLFFEVDEFYGENQGLIMAEIELATEDQTFDKPGWLGDEVTGDIRFYNSALSKYPFTKWG